MQKISKHIIDLAQYLFCKTYFSYGKSDVSQDKTKKLHHLILFVYIFFCISNRKVDYLKLAHDFLLRKLIMIILINFRNKKFTHF